MLIPLEIESIFTGVRRMALARSIYADLAEWVGKTCKDEKERGADQQKILCGRQGVPLQIQKNIYVRSRI